MSGCHFLSGEGNHFGTCPALGLLSSRCLFLSEKRKTMLLVIPEIQRGLSASCTSNPPLRNLCSNVMDQSFCVVSSPLLSVNMSGTTSSSQLHLIPCVPYSPSVEEKPRALILQPQLECGAAVWMGQRGMLHCKIFPLRGLWSLFWLAEGRRGSDIADVTYIWQKGLFVKFPAIIWIRRYSPCSRSGRDFCGETTRSRPFLEARGPWELARAICYKWASLLKKNVKNLRRKKTISCPAA